MVASPEPLTMTLEEFLENPRDRMEWIDGQLIEKKEMNAKTGRIQARLSYYWRAYFLEHAPGSEVYTETPCRTIGRTRCPDVAYLTPDLVAQYGDFKTLPHSFSLIAEIISPTDAAEEVFTKVGEYLASQGQEVWLVLPESRMVLVITPDQQKLYGMNDILSTQAVLPGFSVPVRELIA
ncbi:MAG: Uma2 family endonuclease [Oculatellaceae cyanobacterium Prado106]|nr:Uma2 family endonuclease [Oculatellaceae cyanobacterium Prado106]